MGVAVSHGYTAYDAALAADLVATLRQAQELGSWALLRARVAGQEEPPLAGYGFDTLLRFTVGDVRAQGADPAARLAYPRQALLEALDGDRDPAVLTPWFVARLAIRAQLEGPLDPRSRVDWVEALSWTADPVRRRGVRVADLPEGERKRGLLALVGGAHLVPDIADTPVRRALFGSRAVPDEARAWCPVEGTWSPVEDSASAAWQAVPDLDAAIAALGRPLEPPPPATYLDAIGKGLLEDVGGVPYEELLAEAERGAAALHEFYRRARQGGWVVKVAHGPL